jgi:hypothetical protein
MLATHLEAERRYDILRKASLRAISSQLNSIPNLEFKLIDKAALTKADKWNLSPNRKVDWEWDNYASFKVKVSQKV